MSSHIPISEKCMQHSYLFRTPYFFFPSSRKKDFL